MYYNCADKVIVMEEGRVNKVILEDKQISTGIFA